MIEMTEENVLVHVDHLVKALPDHSGHYHPKTSWRSTCCR